MTRPGGHLTDAAAQQLVDGALPPGEDAAAAAHLEACPDCAALVETYRVLSGALEELPAPALPADFTDHVLERVAARERDLARERKAAAVVLGGVFTALVAVLLVGGNGVWVPATARLAEQVAPAWRVLSLGAEVLPPILGAVRLPLAAIAALLAFPVLYALSRLIPSPRTEVS